MNEFVKVDDWHREPEDAYIYAEDGVVKINLDKCMPDSIKRLREKSPDKIEKLSTFTITRRAFINYLGTIVKYIDYFIEFYDDEKELPALYSHWKNIIDSEDTILTEGEFRHMLIRNIFKESNIKKNVYRMVDDNMYIDSTVDKKTGRRFEAKSDFTNDDMRRYLAIAIVMKMIIPPFDHYVNLGIKKGYIKGPADQLTTKLFADIMYKVGDIKGDCGTDILIEKLYLFIMKKTSKHAKDNIGSWEQESALRGVTEQSHIDRLSSKYITYDNLFKLKFNYPMANFIKSILNLQLKCTIEIPQFDATPIRIDTTKGPNGIAEGLHNAEQQLIKMDESLSIIVNKSLDDIINKLEKRVGGITKDEIEYYNKFIVHNDWFQSYLLTNFFAKEFDGFQEQRIMSNYHYIRLVIIGKRLLTEQGYVELPWIFSAIPVGKLSNRMLRNTKTLDRIKASEPHKMLMDNKYACLKGFRDDEDINITSKIINNAYLWNEYEKPEITGEPITFDGDVIAAEVQRFMDSI